VVKNLVGGSTQEDWCVKYFSAIGAEDSAKQFTADGNGGTDMLYAICVDKRGNLYLAGYGIGLLTESGQWVTWIKKIIYDDP
jgi:hypothetical protein